MLSNYLRIFALGIFVAIANSNQCTINEDCS